MEPLRILVYPHAMELGGSQLNAIEVASAIRRRGHEVVVYAPDGPLLSRVHELGLPHVPAPDSRIRPSPGLALDLARLIESMHIDVIHAYEWPPVLEAFAATSLRRRAVTVATVMSMSVPPFLPASVTLTVGTRRILESTLRSRGAVHLMEPPVDTDANRPDIAQEEFSDRYPVPEGTHQVVIVSRLVRELKLEGILAAVRAVGKLASSRSVRLVIVGDGASRGEIERAAAEVNAVCRREVILLTGELSDPRGAYDIADVCIGMGGSALRALAFAKPLIVQGELGFFETLTARTVDVFRQQGWYGTGSRIDSIAAEARLVAQLETLLDDVDLRRRLGAFGRQLVVVEFSLERAARVQEDVYCAAIAQRASLGRTLADGCVAGAGLVRYKLDRRLNRLRGTLTVDDFNARPE
ncbi:MAG: glycosyltransferase [Nocardioidaceae bacterium]